MPENEELKELTEIYRHTVELAQKLIEINADLNNTLNKAIVIGEKISAISKKEENE